MYELIERPQDTAIWEDAVAGRPVNWNSLLEDYRATLDFPLLSSGGNPQANPDEFVLLSSRDSTERWWASVSGQSFPR